MTKGAGSVVALFGLLTGGLLGAVTAGSEEIEAVATSTTSVAIEVTTTVAQSATTARAPATTNAPTSTSSSTTERPTTTACQDTFQSWSWPTTTEGPVVECPASPNGVPSLVLTRPPTQGWIAVLESIEVWNVDLVDPRAQVLLQNDSVQLLDSRQYLLLRDPYWVLYAGPFQTREAASQFCTQRSYLDPCYPRELG